LLVSGPTIATSLIYALCHDGPEVRATTHGIGSRQIPTIVFHAHRFEQAVGPTQPIEGIIRDKDTARPIAGVRLRGALYKEGNIVPTPGVEALSDSQGHYRLMGLARGSAYRLFVEPKEGLPYPKAILRATPRSAEPAPLIFDITLQRGIVVRGKVTDKATGQPVPGIVSAYTLADNPHVREFPGYTESQPPQVYVNDDGRYEIVALPGRGVIACASDVNRYRLDEANQTCYATLPRMICGFDFHVSAPVDLAPRSETATLDLRVDPGLTVRIAAVDPEGRPIVGTKASGLSPSAGLEFEQDSPSFEVRALGPSEHRRVTIRHEGRKLVGSVYLGGDSAGPVTVQLLPWGAITGRIVNEAGEPRGDLLLTSLGSLGPQAKADEGRLPGSDGSPAIPLGRDGWFRIEGLVPGLKYGAYAAKGSARLGEVFRNVAVAPSEVKVLGDLKIVPLK
jgi:hypothetical protein